MKSSKQRSPQDQADRVSSRRIRPLAPANRSGAAFTLIEVMIALGIFFMCAFAILAMVSTTLRNARGLRERRPDAGTLASQLSLTNKVYEGSESGDFSDLGDLYSGYSWESQDTEVQSNGLHQVDFVVRRRYGGRDVEAHMSILLFRPESPPGSASGQTIGGGFSR